MTRLRKSVLLMAALIAAAVGVHAATAGDTETNGTLSSDAVTTVDPGLSGAFAVLRRPRDAARDHLPRDTFPAGTQIPFGINPAMSRKALDDDNGIFVVPGDKEVCLATGNGDTACTTEQTALDPGHVLALISSPGGDSQVVALFPDGVKNVEVRDNQGQDHALAVTNNVAVGSEGVVSWTDRSGVDHQQSLDAPSPTG